MDNYLGLRAPIRKVWSLFYRNENTYNYGPKCQLLELLVIHEEQKLDQRYAK